MEFWLTYRLGGPPSSKGRRAEGYQRTRRALALDTLTPATPRDDAIVFDLRYAASLLTDARAKGIGNEEALSVLRACRKT